MKHFARYMARILMAPAPTLYGQGHQLRQSSQRTIKPLVGGVLVLDVLNTIDRHDGAGYDYLAPGYANIVDWFARAGTLDPDDALRLLRKAQKEPREAATVRKRAAALREALAVIVSSMTMGQEVPAEALGTFNEESRHARANGTYIVSGGRLAWQWTQPHALDRVLWEVCRSATGLLGSERVARIRECAAPTCGSFFLDTSKNGSRQFCSASTCGTATRVRRFRERQKSSV